jgi:hypothetical protein
MKYSKLFLTIISGALFFSCTKPRTTVGEFIVVITGNVQGSLQPHKARLNSLGGLARRATFLKDLRAAGNEPILLDAGNLFNAKDNSIGLIKCYNEIGYDALNIGAQDLANAINISNLEKTAEFPFISANIIHSRSGKPVFKLFTILERNGFIIAVIGLTNNLLENSSGKYGIKDPIQTGKDLLGKLANRSDYQVVLFNGSYDDAVVTRDALVEADFMFISGHGGTPRKTRPPEKGPFLYKVGEFGRALVTIKTHVAHIDSSLKDISMLIEREKFIKETLHLLHGGASISLEEMYAGNHDMTQRIKRIKTELQLAQTELASTTNTVEFDYIPLSSSIIDDADIKRIINEASITVN